MDDRRDRHSDDGAIEPSEPHAPAEGALDPPAGAPTRRALIASIAGLAGAAMAKAVTRPAEAVAACEPLASDCANVVAGTTQLDRSQPSGALVGPVLQADAGEGSAIRGNAPYGAGVVGVSGPLSAIGGPATPTIGDDLRVGGAFLADVGTGVLGVSSPVDLGPVAVHEIATLTAGVVGLSSREGAGLVGMTTVATGTASWPRLGAAGGGVGVLGLQGQTDGIFPATGTLLLGGGLVGLTGEGTGVFGASATATGTAMLAYNRSGGFALRVAGAAAFSTIGAGVVPEKTLAVDVQDPNVSANSHIMVTFTSFAKSLYVSWVEIVEGFGFRLHLSKKHKLPVSFTYLVLDREP